jgi:biotin transport system substrate-specific component
MRKTTAMILSALFAALTAVGALIRVPTGVSSFTLQIFFSAMAGLLLGAKWGAASQIVYLILGLAGLPIFTGGSGPGAFLHPTGGFLLGMAAMAWVIGRIGERGGGLRRYLLACLGGLAVLYGVGLPWMHGVLVWVLNREWTLWQTVSGGMLLFLPWDLLKLAAAALLCARIRPLLYRN